ncbi:MAG: hypothetical protein JWO45_2175 [Spartobacteria bacterium]|nr:hypothetical protein [Spartobacteria bacterium]
MTMTKLICPECRHENESERIYCHSCGARLDRSAVRVQKEPPDDTRKRVKRMFDPQRAKIRALFFAISKLVLGACGTAILILVVLPADVPPPAKTEILASQIRFDLEGMSSKRQPPQLQYSEEQANAFLGYSLRSKQAALNKPLLDFKRASVTFREKSCAFTTERSVFGYPVYATCIFSPSLNEGNLSAPIQGGSIGRLQIHPKIAQFMGILFADVWSALERDIKTVSKLGAMEFHDKNVVLTAPPA